MALDVIVIVVIRQKRGVSFLGRNKNALRVPERIVSVKSDGFDHIN
jgi:hypothetical protein